MKVWNYLNNTFLVITEESYRTAKKLGDYTLAALQAKNSDPVIGPLATAFKPYVDNFNAAYNNWLSKLGVQKSFTSDLMVNLKLLSSYKIKQWDIAIQGQFLEGSTKYISILPNHRTPFQNGSQEDRLAACDALSIALTGITALATTKTDVDAFIVTLKASFNAQKGSLSNTVTNSDNLDTARINMCIELYSILGKLMSIYKTKPTDAQQFFDMETIRNHEQTLFKGTLHPNELELILTHTFEDGEQIRLVNKGATPLRFALLPLATSVMDEATSFQEVAPNDEDIITVSSLGNLANRFLKVLNTDDTTGNKYSVMLL
jgi:hypothetical protein